MHRLLFPMLFLLLLITACTGDVAGDPSDAVERYIQAKADGDADVIGQLLCSEMESVLEREVQSFASVEARTEGLACTSQSDDDNIVACEGAIVATYGLEDREFPLTSYRVVQEDGEWRWCGESE